MSNISINYSLVWEKIKESAKRIGLESVRQALLMYFVLKSPETPRSEKILIYSAITYLVFPIDLIPSRRFPIIGWLDELVSATVAIQKLRRYITPAIEYEVDRILDDWFPTYAEYVEMIDE